MKKFFSKILVKVVGFGLKNKFRSKDSGEGKDALDSSTVRFEIVGFLIAVYYLFRVVVAPILGWNLPEIPEWAIEIADKAFGVTAVGASLGALRGRLKSTEKIKLD